MPRTQAEEQNRALQVVIISKQSLTLVIHHRRNAHFLSSAVNQRNVNTKHEIYSI